MIALTLGDLSIDIVSRRDRGPASWALIETVGYGLDWVAGHRRGLIVIDTLDKWAGIEDENSPSEVVRRSSSRSPGPKRGRRS